MIKRWWAHNVRAPLLRRKLRNGTMALLFLNERMKRAGWSRQRRRQSMRAVFRTPEQLHFVLDLVYGESGLGRHPE